MGRPPRSAWCPRGPGTDLQGKVTGEGTLLLHQQPKRDHRGGSSTWGLAPEKVSVGLANGKQPTHRERGCAPPLPQGDPEDARKTLFPGLEFPVPRKWGESQAPHLTLISFKAMMMWTTARLKGTGLCWAFQASELPGWLLPCPESSPGPTDPPNPAEAPDYLPTSSHPLPMPPTHARAAPRYPA